MSRRVLGIPLAVVDDVEEPEELGRGRRGDRESAEREDLCVEVLSDAVLDMRHMVEQVIRSKVRQEEIQCDENREENGDPDFDELPGELNPEGFDPRLEAESSEERSDNRAGAGQKKCKRDQAAAQVENNGPRIVKDIEAVRNESKDENLR